MNSLQHQRDRILTWFNSHPSLTTIQGREILGVIHPAGRINELRKAGYQIMTYWADEEDAQGNMHRVARYVMKGRAL